MPRVSKKQYRGSKFDTYDLENGYITNNQLKKEKNKNKVTILDSIHSIYRIGISRDNMSYEEMEECDLLDYIDYIIFTLKFNNKEGGEY